MRKYCAYPDELSWFAPWKPMKIAEISIDRFASLEKQKRVIDEIESIVLMLDIEVDFINLDKMEKIRNKQGDKIRRMRYGQTMEAVRHAIEWGYEWPLSLEDLKLPADASREKIDEVLQRVGDVMTGFHYPDGV
jgi:hypothetical protein